MTKVFSSEEEGSTEVQEGVGDAITHWSEQTIEALKNQRKLQTLVSRIIRRVKEKYSEAKFGFGIGQDEEGWELSVYTNSNSSWQVRDWVKKGINETDLERLGLHLVPLGLDQAEQGGA